TPAEAVLALMSAERIDPEQESVEQAGGDERAAFEQWEAEQIAFVLRQIGSMDADAIDSDNVDLRFEDASGRDTGCDVSIVDYAEKAANLIEAMLSDRAALAQPSPALAEQATADDYEEVLADHRRLVRELDVLLNGEACAAKQAMLCDLVSQVEAEVRKSGQPLLVSAERYRWLRNDDNWGADDSEGQGTSKWANLGELSGTDFDAYLDQLRGSNPVMDIDPEHSKAIAKRGRDAIVAQPEEAPVIGCLCGMPMTEGHHSPDGCSSLEEFAPHLSAQAQAKQAERPEVVAFRYRCTNAEGEPLPGWFYSDDAGTLGLREPLTTVAECDRIVGALRYKAELYDEVWALVTGKGYMNVTTAIAKLEQERDAVLARVAELERQEPVAWMHDQPNRVDVIHRDVKDLLQRVPGSSRGIHRPLDVSEHYTIPLYAAPVAQAQHSVPEGLALIPVRETEAMHDAVMALLYKGVARTDTQKLLDAYIAAAPGKEVGHE
ncbi:TPA: hypothetical protein ACF3MW_004088, partial [Pseudomonas aeruginosa]